VSKGKRVHYIKLLFLYHIFSSFVSVVSNSDPHLGQDTCPSSSESLEDTSKGSLPSDFLESSIQNIFETIFSSQGIDCPEDIHPPKTGPSVLSKTISVTNSIGSLLHLWSSLCYPIIPCFTHGPRPLLQRKQLQKAADVAPTIKSKIFAVTEIATCKSSA